MTKPINTAAIQKATGKQWSDWIQELDGMGVRNMTHLELARSLASKLEGKVQSHGWWAQGITVAYEQHIGRRQPGQLADGTFEVAVSKTVLKSRGDVFPQIVAWFESQPRLRGFDCLKPRYTETPKRSNWRCDFADGSKFIASVEENADKSKLVLAHTAIPAKQEADEWKEFWRGIAVQLAAF